MASVTVTPQPTGEPPRNLLQLEAAPGCILESCELTRVQDGSEQSVRRQPSLGVSNPVCYDYETRYGVEARYRMTGLEKQILSTAWTGTANASTSTLSQDGTVVATQLFPNPNFNPNGSPPTLNGVTTAMSDGSLSVTASSTALDRYAMFIIRNLNPGDSVMFAVRVTSDSNAQYPAVVISNSSWSILVNIYAGGDKTVVSSAFTVPSDGVLQILFYPYRHDAASDPTQARVFVHPQLCTESDWAAMQALGLTWFAGDSITPGVVSSYDVTSDPTMLTPDCGWLIHPATPAKSMRLPLGRLTTIGDVTRRMNATRHDILGARYPVYTIPGPRHSREYELQLRTRSLGEESMLDALLDDQTPILLNLLNEDCTRLNLQPMYLQVGDTVDSRYAQTLYPPDGDTPDLMREWKLPCIQVASPAIGQQVAGWTYAQLLSDYSTYQQTRNTYQSYADLIQNNKES